MFQNRKVVIIRWIRNDVLGISLAGNQVVGGEVGEYKTTI